MFVRQFYIICKQEHLPYVIYQHPWENWDVVIYIVAGMRMLNILWRVKVIHVSSRTFPDPISWTVSTQPAAAPGTVTECACLTGSGLSTVYPCEASSCLDNFCGTRPLKENAHSSSRLTTTEDITFRSDHAQIALRRRKRGRSSLPLCRWSRAASR